MMAFFRFSTVVVALAFISFSAVAQDFITLVSDNSQAAILAFETKVPHSGEPANCPTGIEAEAEFSHLIEALMNINEYHAAEFVEAELALETKAWMTAAN